MVAIFTAKARSAGSRSKETHVRHLALGNALQKCGDLSGAADARFMARTATLRGRDLEDAHAVTLGWGKDNEDRRRGDFCFAEKQKLPRFFCPL